MQCCRAAADSHGFADTAIFSEGSFEGRDRFAQDIIAAAQERQDRRLERLLHRLELSFQIEEWNHEVSPSTVSNNLGAVAFAPA
ncbi:hypothetical protein FG93_04503 [Bosea sp. LC85]|nr:hypothetical protein FG93_04503 [Bosea sp. LC85]